jgi:competence protein ComEA
MEAVPRPSPDSRHAALAERWQRWRADPRIGVALLVCVAIAAGVAWFRSGIAPASPSSEDVPASASSSLPSTSTSTTSTTTASVVVDVVGAVHNAGVVTLPGGARVIDAIEAAGGAAGGADLTRLNLAAVLGDGARVAVPLVGQPPPPIDPTAVSGASAAGAPSGASPSASETGAAERVNVNTASAQELEALPGVGPATAAAIIAERESNGPFTVIDDLDRVQGIGPAKLEQLRDHVTV